MSLIEHLEKLRHFQKVTNYRSINEASRAIGLSQAGLSKSIAGLEDALNVVLFVRSREGLILTKEGELLLKTTKEIIELAGHTETTLRSLKATDAPEKIRVGMYDSVAIYFFPDLNSYIKKIYPNVDIELVVDTSSHLEELVVTGKIDMAIGANLNRSGHPRSEFSLLFEDTYSFFVSPEKQHELPRMPLIYHPAAEDGKGQDLRQLLTPLIKNRISHKTYNFETIKELTRLGVGIGVLPTRVAAPLILRKELINVSLPKNQQHFGEHSIGFLVSTKFSKGHESFTKDIRRLGERWVRI